MSNIYIQEPPTNGKVLLSTSVGDIDIELWPREAPKACRNFVQLCLEGYYDGTIFHRVVKDFIVQGGDPTGTGDGGESIYGKPFKDEFHTRLRFVRRGLVAMANAGQNDNGSQFFITMGPTQELQNKHTIFGKIGGDTIYNVLRLQDCEVDANDRPVYPHKIKSTKVLSNPFDDIEPRLKQTTHTDDDQKQRSKKKGTKNFSLLSFGEEAEEEEEVLGAVTKERKGKSKSSHDLIDDPTLSTVTAVDVEDSVKRKIEDPDAAESVRKKLKESSSESKEKKVTDNIPSDDDELSVKQKRRDELRKEAKELQRELLGKSKQKTEKEENENNQKKSKEPANDLVASYMQEKQKYQNIKKSQQKGTSREEQTMALLNKFKSKLESVKKLAGDYDDEGDDDDEKTEKNGEEEEESADDISWLRHKLTFEKSTKAALDANVRELDRYEISDPRNPLTQRRREASKQVMKEKK